MHTINKIIRFDHIKKSTVYLYTVKKKFENFVAAGEVQELDLLRKVHRRWSTVKRPIPVGCLLDIMNSDPGSSMRFIMYGDGRVREDFEGDNAGGHSLQVLSPEKRTIHVIGDQDLAGGEAKKLLARSSTPSSPTS
jgi:hypothetical protein